MGKRIFINDQEMTNKNDFDGKVNVKNPLYQTTYKPLTKDDLCSFSAPNGGALQLIHQMTADTGTDTLGNWDNILFMSGFDVINLIDLGNPKGVVKISHLSTLNPGNNWSENIAWKSDIQRLEQRISALEKQIGGVLSRLLTHLNNHLVRKVAA